MVSYRPEGYLNTILTISVCILLILLSYMSLSFFFYTISTCFLRLELSFWIYTNLCLVYVDTNNILIAVRLHLLVILQRTWVWSVTYRLFISPKKQKKWSEILYFLMVRWFCSEGCNFIRGMEEFVFAVQAQRCIKGQWHPGVC